MFWTTRHPRSARFLLRLAGVGVAATASTDTRIQPGFISVTARVRYVARDFSMMAVCVTASDHANTVFGVGSTAMVDLTPTTPTTLLKGASTVQQLRPQMLINIHCSLSNRKGRLMITVHGITELPRLAPTDSRSQVERPINSGRLLQPC
jgi:hypothetical protein